MLPPKEHRRTIFLWAAAVFLVAGLALPGAVLLDGDRGESSSSTWQERAAAPRPAQGTRTAPVAPDAFAPEAILTSRTRGEAPMEDLLAARSAAAQPAEPRRLDCIIEPHERVDIGSAETGLISAIHFDRGDTVTAGALVAELESEVEQSAVRVAEARAAMDADVRSSVVASSLGQRKRDRANELFAVDILSLDLREQVDTEAALAEFEHERALERRRLADLQLAQARADLARRRITSPISGVVVERLKSVGEVVKEEAIVSVAQLDPLSVEVILPAPLFGQVQKGMRAEVVPERPAEGSYIATVDVVDAVIDAASGTFGVRLDLPNPDHAIPSGLHCKVRLLDDT